LHDRGVPLLTLGLCLLPGRLLLFCFLLAFLEVGAHSNCTAGVVDSAISVRADVDALAYVVAVGYERCLGGVANGGGRFASSSSSGSCSSSTLADASVDLTMVYS